MAQKRAKNDSEAGFVSCCNRISKEVAKARPNEKGIAELEKAKNRNAYLGNIVRDTKRSKANFADVGR